MKNKHGKKVFPEVNITRYYQKQIYEHHIKFYPKEDFIKFLEKAKRYRSNFDWKEYIRRYMPDLKPGPKLGSFPESLLLSKFKYPIPGTLFNETPKPVTLHEFKIYVATDDYFEVKFRNIFTNSGLKFESKKQCDAWNSAPNINYWPQQLNFAVWCATSGCGISLNEKYPKRIQQFISFHVYFTIRRILYEMRVKLADENDFHPDDNHYNAVAFKNLCREFNLVENSDFRFKGGINSGLGVVHINNGGWGIPGPGEYLEYWPNNLGTRIFKDDPPNKHYLEGFILANQKQYEWFLPNAGSGLTKAGMGRLNRSVEVFVYCIAGSQVQTRSSIVGKGGIGQNTQKQMLRLFEAAIIEEDIAKSVQRYQLVIQEAKFQLNFTIAPSVWLIPSNLILNTESVVGYNNFLQKASDSMTFGLNQAVNIDSKPVGLNHNIKKNKVILPHGMKKEKEKPAILKEKPVIIEKVKPTLKKSEIENHELNKNVVMITAAGLGWWLFRR